MSTRKKTVEMDETIIKYYYYYSIEFSHTRPHRMRIHVVNASVNYREIMISCRVCSFVFNSIINDYDLL